MKLYAIVTSERDSRPAKKGDNDSLTINITNGNTIMASLLILQKSNMITVSHKTGILVVNGNKVA